MTSTTTLATLQPKIIREAQFLFTQSSIMRGLVRNFTVPYGTGKTVNVPYYPLVEGEKKAELEAFTDQDITTSEKTLTVNRYGFSTLISDESTMTSTDNVIASIGRLAGEGVARLIDADLAALLAGFSKVVGSDTTPLAAAHIFQAAAELNSLGIPSSQLVAVINPKIAYDLKASLTNTMVNPYGGPIQNEAMISGYVGSIGGVAIYETSRVAIDAQESIGGLYHRDAIGFALLKDISIEFIRVPERNATRMVVSAYAGAGELVDAYGVSLSNKSSLA